ncbi:hypothetical protein CPC08DRAFT_728579 [Agrocybe pediades]|nr:hypothetical protein CPC08DRAFT_728579 [Agrocybe pediades]
MHTAGTHARRDEDATRRAPYDNPWFCREMPLGMHGFGRRETAASVLDAIMQTVATESLTNQTLVARVESIDVRTWWLQALVPALTVLLYALSVMYTCFLSGGEVAKVKEINLAEIIDAAVD